MTVGGYIDRGEGFSSIEIPSNQIDEIRSGLVRLELKGVSEKVGSILEDYKGKEEEGINKELEEIQDLHLKNRFDDFSTYYPDAYILEQIVYAQEIAVLSTELYTVALHYIKEGSSFSHALKQVQAQIVIESLPDEVKGIAQGKADQTTSTHTAALKWAIQKIRLAEGEVKFPEINS